jgi:hypothetical protein
MVAVPEVTPVASPKDVMVTTAVLLLLQLPPVTASDNSVATPWQIVAGDGMIAEGVELTATCLVAAQPAGLV